MAKERLRSPRARLFVALDLPDEVRSALAGWQARALTDEALRPVRPEALHVTLCFLGYRPERDVERVARVVTGVGARPVGLRFRAEPVLVPRGRPRLFAADAESDGSVALAAELSSRLLAERLYEPEKRPFWPHVTVARVRPERGSRRPRRVEGAPEELPGELLAPFGAVRMTLYRSILRPEGAEYAPLAVLKLPPLAGER